MNARHSSAREIIGINAALFGAFCLGFLAWLLWPDTSLWWQAGVMSVLFGAASFSLVIQGLRRITDLIIRERERRAFLRQGRAPRSDGLAGEDTLRERGIL